MLVLQRGESQFIDLTLPDGTVIGVQLVRAFDRKAKIGIDAPRSVRIDRREVTLARAAAGAGTKADKDGATAAAHD